MSELSAPRSGLRQRLMRGFGATALSPVVTALIQLGSVPVLLHVWGAAKYGDWLLLSAIPSYLTLSDLGLGDASGSEMSMRVAAGDREAALQAFQSSWVLVTGVSFAILSVALLLVWWIPWQGWLKLSSVSSRQAAEVISVLGAYVVISQQNGIAESGYRSDGHFASGAFWMTLLRLAEVVAATIVAVAGGRFLAVAAGYLVVRTLGTVGYMLLLRHLSPWIRFGIGHARWKTIRQMAAPAFGFMAIPVGYALSLQGFTIAIGAMLGPIAVVSFSTLRTLSRVSLQLTVVIKHALWPELSRAFGAGDVSLARRLHRHACQASLAISALGCLSLWLVGPYIYRLWIRQNISFDAACFHVLLLVVIANSLWDTSSVIPMSTNSHCRIAVIYSGVTALSLGLACVLMPAFGTVGAALAVLAADGCMAGIVLRASLSRVQDTPSRFAASLLATPRFRQALPSALES
jgi:O-antigen/teichoic acid export membrane protein